MIQDQQLMQFLVGLNEDYKVIRGSILMMKPLLNIDQVYSLIQQEEKQRSLTAVSQFSHDSAAFLADLSSKDTTQTEHSALAIQHRGYNSQQKAVQLGNYNSNGNFKNMPKGGVQDKRQLFCDYCKMTGHTIQTCYKIHGYPPEHKLYKGRRVAAVAQSAGTAAIPSNSLGNTQLIKTLMMILSQLLVLWQGRAMQKGIILGRENKGLYCMK